MGGRALLCMAAGVVNVNSVGVRNNDVIIGSVLMRGAPANVRQFVIPASSIRNNDIQIFKYISSLGRWTTTDANNRTIGVDLSHLVISHELIGSVYYRVGTGIADRDFKCRCEVSPNERYGMLNFHYPLPPQWTGYYTRYVNHPGNGLDLNAPDDTEIYSVDAGSVVDRGYNVQRGFYVVTRNNTNDPNKSTSINNRLITRYLHMNGEPSVALNQTIQRGQLIGRVGKTGTFVGSAPANHLHIDFNSRNIIHENLSFSEGIDAKLFWPNVNFHLNNTPRSIISPTYHVDEYSIDELLAMGKHFDGELLDMVGWAEFAQWLERTPEEEQTVYKLIEDYGITVEDLQANIRESMFEAIIRGD